MSNVVLFGAGKIAEVAYYYLTNDSPHDVLAFTVDKEYLTQSTLLGLPVVPFEEVEELFPPDSAKMLVAVGYTDLNRMRAAKYTEAKAKGYELISYVSTRASNFGNINIGENCLILENQSLQPFSRIGNNVIVWSGNHIGHHSTIEDHCFITSHIVISGNTTVEPYCFIGVNATIGHGITIGRESMIGAGCMLTKDAKPKSVYIAKDTEAYGLDSDRFLRFAKL